MNLITDPKFLISLLLLGISGLCIFYFPNSNPHMILGTNLVTGIGGYWIGSSISSSDKTAALFKIKENSNEVQKVDAGVSNPSAVG